MVRVYPGTHLYKNILNANENRHVLIVTIEGKFVDVISDYNSLEIELRNHNIILGDLISEKYNNKVFSATDNLGNRLEVEVQTTWIKSI